MARNSPYAFALSSGCRKTEVGVPGPNVRTRYLVDRSITERRHQVLGEHQLVVLACERSEWLALGVTPLDDPLLAVLPEPHLRFGLAPGRRQSLLRRDPPHLVGYRVLDHALLVAQPDHGQVPLLERRRRLVPTQVRTDVGSLIPTRWQLSDRAEVSSFCHGYPLRSPISCTQRALRQCISAHLCPPLRLNDCGVWPSH